MHLHLLVGAACRCGSRCVGRGRVLHAMVRGGPSRRHRIRGRRTAGMPCCDGGLPAGRVAPTRRPHSLPFFSSFLSSRRQVELPDYWLDAGNPWEIRRPETQFK